MRQIEMLIYEDQAEMKLKFRSVRKAHEFMCRSFERRKPTVVFSRMHVNSKLNSGWMIAGVNGRKIVMLRQK